MPPCVESPPIAQDDMGFAVLNQSSLTVTAEDGVLANDSDPDSGPSPLTAVILTQPEHGAVSLNGDGSFTYDPDDTYFGQDTFQYRAYDGSQYSDPATVAIFVDTVLIKVTFPDDVEEEYKDKDQELFKEIWIGQQVKAEVKTKANAVGIDNQLWDIEDVYIKEYFESPTLGTVTKHNDVQKEAATIEFYWVSPPGIGFTKEIGVSVNDGDATVTVDLKVREPSVTMAAATANAVTPSSQGGDPPTRYGATFMELPNTPGIKFTATTPPFNSNIGDYKYLQVVNQAYMYAEAEDGTPMQMVEHLDALDNDTTYPAQSNNGVNQHYAEDSPNYHPLISANGKTLQKVIYDAEFSMSFMFKPEYDSSIWVPLWQIDWWVNWEVQKSGGVYGLVDSDWRVFDPALQQVVRTHQHLTWTDLATNVGGAGLGVSLADSSIPAPDAPLTTGRVRSDWSDEVVKRDYAIGMDHMASIREKTALRTGPSDTEPVRRIAEASSTNHEHLPEGSSGRTAVQVTAAAALDSALQVLAFEPVFERRM